MPTRWRLNSIDFEINPSSVNPSRRKVFHIIKIVDGAAVVQEGREDVPSMSAEITALTETAYRQLMTWFETSGTLTLIDDHGYNYSVLIESLNLKRQWSASHDWYFTGTIEFRVFSGFLYS